MSSPQLHPGDAHDDGSQPTQMDPSPAPSKAETTWADPLDEEDNELIDQVVQRTKDRILGRLQGSHGTESSEMEPSEHKSRPWSDATLVDTIRHSYWKGIADEADRKREKEVRRACDACLSYQIRCDGEKPCFNCIALARSECVYRHEIEHGASSNKPKISKKDRKRSRKVMSPMKTPTASSSRDETVLNRSKQQQSPSATVQKKTHHHESLDNKNLFLPLRAKLNHLYRDWPRQVSKEGAGDDAIADLLAPKSSEPQLGTQDLQLLPATYDSGFTQSLNDEQKNDAREGRRSEARLHGRSLADTIVDDAPTGVASQAYILTGSAKPSAVGEGEDFSKKSDDYSIQNLRMSPAPAPARLQAQELKRVRRKKSSSSMRYAAREHPHSADRGSSPAHLLAHESASVHLQDLSILAGGLDGSSSTSLELDTPQTESPRSTSRSPPKPESRGKDENGHSDARLQPFRLMQGDEVIATFDRSRPEQPQGELPSLLSSTGLYARANKPGEKGRQRQQREGSRSGVDHRKTGRVSKQPLSTPSSTGQSSGADNSATRTTSRRSQATGKRQPRVGCPFAKHRPSRYETVFNQCTLPPGLEPKRLAEHIRRVHSPQYKGACIWCSKKWTDPRNWYSEFETHDCHVRNDPAQLNTNPESMTLAQVEAFESLNTSNIIEADERWLIVYRTLFPSEWPIPSPWYDYYQITHRLRSAQPASSSPPGFDSGTAMTASSTLDSSNTSLLDPFGFPSTFPPLISTANDETPTLYTYMNSFGSDTMPYNALYPAQVATSSGVSIGDVWIDQPPMDSNSRPWLGSRSGGADLPPRELR